MRALGVIGRILIGAGVVILLFAAYQVWGTSLQEAHTQTALRHTFVSDAKSNQLEQALNQATAQDALPTGPPAVAPTTNAPAEGQPVGDLRIPKIGINQIMVEGTNTQDLRKGPGHYTGTPLPGQSGNASVAGHRTTYGHPFYNLDGVAVGDPVVVTTVQGVFVYDAVKSEVVSPNDNSVLNNTSGHMLTLTTCNPRFSASSRLVVVAQLAHSKLFSGVAAAKPPTANTHPSQTAQPSSGALGGASDGQVLTAVLWGIVVCGVGALVLMMAYFFRRQRWFIWGVGTVGVVVLLYFFFGAVTPLLPASL
ncbi:MAG TPA: class E sortase [Acidimicrobiales bacterium]|jgi:sortase A|nr:class E sortase [Acidimicrobiales bacterium]